ncbi:diguanylate cyclase [Clostridium thermarum]|uniref:diguanylate cyclase n=1 Tax=Clostridium thermarum TaxID=1716543 RepID=UPI00111CB46F|nr:diguanylate cyclase [Clostridium thermarum]
MAKRVLIADDSKLNIAMITDILHSEGYEVFSVMSGSEVFDAVKNIKPDIILLDVIMPGMDGFSVCRELKNDYDLKNIPVIMVTARKETTYLKTALEIGAFDYIRKPVDSLEVIARIQSALRYKEYQDKLEEMAMKDGLTGLYNHALIIDLLTKEYSKQNRQGGPIAFAMLDIDYFKKVNDTYGHLKGNEVLKGVADIIQSSIRDSDIAGRYGGEEFSLIFSQLSADKVFAVCERIRRRIGLQSFNLDGETINITISIGVCYKPIGVDISRNEMIQIADEALYEAKHSGRNNVKIRYAGEELIDTPHSYLNRFKTL